MPVYGSVAYVPNGRFSFKRAYIDNIVFRFGEGALFSHSDGEFVVTDSLNPNVHVVCNLYPNLWAWNSNGYTLDYVLKDWWLLIDPDPTPLPLPTNVVYVFNQTNLKRELWIGLSDATTSYPFALPPAPPDYWLNNP